MEYPMTPKILTSIALIAPESWNALIGSSYPFLSHEFLLALESSHSVGAGTGWQTQHLIIEEDGRLVAAMPLWLKTHSWGEYVFDQEWAHAYARHGLSYYPKLVAAIPFTPASGARLIIAPDSNVSDIFVLVIQTLCDLTRHTGASGWHVLFPEEMETPLWQQTGVDHRLGCQFHWVNRDYNTFEDFLAGLSAKRRKEIRRERKRVHDQGIRLQRLTGDELTAEHWVQFYHFYRDTYQRRSGHDGYLTEAFFFAIHHSLRQQLLLVLAYDESDIAIGGALCFYSDDTLYGRYWGALRDIECLHFEACLYQGIEFCIERGLQRFDPGAQGEHKIPRGFEPVLTHSFHYLEHAGFREAVAEFLVQEREGVRNYAEEARGLLPFKK
jgi:predicted N-acyltransferase